MDFLANQYMAIGFMLITFVISSQDFSRKRVQGYYW